MINPWAQIDWYGSGQMLCLYFLFVSSALFLISAFYSDGGKP